MIRKILFVVVFACVASVLAKPSAENLERARRDSRFVVFEKSFNVTNVITRPVYELGGDNPCCVIAEDYSVYATPKVDKFFENLSFRFDWRFQGKKIGCLISTNIESLIHTNVGIAANTKSFNESPIDEVKLYEKIKKNYL